VPAQGWLVRTLRLTIDKWLPFHAQSFDSAEWSRDRLVSLLKERLGYANKVGLGNFPQAYTHAGLIHTAVTLGELIEARDGRFRAWS
jgi:hypothetical protein